MSGQHFTNPGTDSQPSIQETLTELRSRAEHLIGEIRTIKQFINETGTSKPMGQQFQSLETQARKLETAPSHEDDSAARFNELSRVQFEMSSNVSQRLFRSGKKTELEQKIKDFKTCYKELRKKAETLSDRTQKTR